jgi:hypothetical protein
MFRYLTLGLGWFVALGFSTLPAQDTAAPPVESAPTAAQRELVQQLGDASYIVRDEAAKRLAGQGSAAIEVLTEALDDPDVEIRARARWILDAIRQDEPPQDATNRNAHPGATAAQRRLVQQLGDPSFFVREEASKKLVSQGAAGKAALSEALDDPDVEIRRRARQILQRVIHNEFEARLAAFVADVDGKQQHRLPGWKRFRSLVGDSRDARRLFADMMRSEHALLSAYEKQTPDLSDLFAARVAWLQSQGASGISSTQLLPPPAVATLLLIGSDPAGKEYPQSVGQLYQLLYYPMAKQAITAGSHPAILRTLLETWTNAASSIGSHYGIMIALKYDLRESGLEQARKLINQPTPSPSMLQYAIISVGRFGGEEHVGLLTPLLDNKTVCHTWSNPQLKKNGTIKIQVRDVALVVLLRMKGKDPAQFGFKLLRESPETLYYVYTFGFIDDEEREAVHSKWAEQFRTDEK